MPPPLFSTEETPVMSVRDFLAGILVAWLLMLAFFPQWTGRSARHHYDLFMIGWENPDAPLR